MTKSICACLIWISGILVFAYMLNKVNEWFAVSVLATTFIMTLIVLNKVK